MFNLVFKDLLMNIRDLKYLIQSVLGIFIYLLVLQFFGSTAIYIIGPFLFANIYIISGCGFGEKDEVDIMFNSLPVNRKNVVFSKYLSTLIFIIMGLVITIVFSSIFKLSGFSHINRFINLRDIIILVLFMFIIWMDQ